MTILQDMRCAQTGFMQIQNIQADSYNNYNPRIAGQSRYFSYLTGMGARCYSKLVDGKPVFGFNLPKVNGISTGSVRTECVGVYEGLGAERFYVYSFMIPSDYQYRSGVDCIIMQLHESLQPNGARLPPFELNIAEKTTEPSGKFSIFLKLSHDNGSGTSGGATPSVSVDSSKSLCDFGKWCTVVIKCKASGAASDYLQYWLNDQLILDYSGYVGYPDGGQNYIKFGLYSYPTAADYQWLRSFTKGVVVSDTSETYQSVLDLYNTDLPYASKYTSKGVVLLGDNNAVGAAVAGSQNSSRNWQCNDPVEPYGSTCSILPTISDCIAKSNDCFNFAINGSSISSLSGRIINYLQGVKVSVGDIVIPSTLQGATSILPLGYSFVVKTAGTLPAEPSWVTAPSANDPRVNTVAGGITFTATPRYSDSVGQIQFDSVDFDPTGRLYEARTALSQLRFESHLVILNSGAFDLTNGTVSAVGESLENIRMFFGDIPVITFSPINTTDSVLIEEMAPTLNLGLFGTVHTSGGFISDLGVGQITPYIQRSFKL